MLSRPCMWVKITSKTWVANAIDNYYLKMNVDALVVSDLGYISVGSVLRNCNGMVFVGLAAFSKQTFPGNYVVHVVEALAMREGLKLAKNHGFTISFVQMDAKIELDETRIRDLMTPEASVLNDIWSV